MNIDQNIKIIAEDAISKHFNKFYDIDFDGRNIKVAPLSSNIPKIFNISKNNGNDLLIAFKNDVHFLEDGDYHDIFLIKGDNNNVIGFIIADFTRLTDKNYRKEVKSSVQKNIDQLSGISNTYENLDKIYLKRILYAIRDIVEKISNNVNKSDYLNTSFTQ